MEKNYEFGHQLYGYLFGSTEEETCKTGSLQNNYTRTKTLADGIDGLHFWILKPNGSV